MIITVIGAGNAGYSHSCKLAERGHVVRLLKTSRNMHEDSFATIQQAGGIQFIDDTRAGAHGFHKLACITRDPHEAIPGADVILIVTQSLQHQDLAARLAPLFEDGQLVIVAPGYLGSVYFRQRTSGKHILYAEGESLPYDARIEAPGLVHILFENIRNPLGFMPVAQKEIGLRKAQQLFSNYCLRNSILESAFHNPNLIVHTVGTIMSAARIEYSQGEFWMYREAFTTATWNLVHDLDEEKMNILRAFNLPAQTFADSFQFRTFADLKADSLVAFKNYADHGSPKGPAVVNHRYITEDVPMGMCLMSSIGRKFNIPTPVCDSLINIAASLLQRDFWRTSRTLESLGLAHYSKQQIIDYVTK